MTDGREALERARYLSRTTDLNDHEAQALAYRELGYSHSAIAREVDSTKGTVAAWMGRVIAQYGLPAVEIKIPDERGDLSEVTPARLAGLSGPVREQYEEHARRVLKHVPGDVTDQLEDDG